MTRTIDTLLLLALPASGKSELRRYLDTRSPEQLAELHLRPAVHLDDYPYVHLMRRIAEELRSLGVDPVFFGSSDEGWLEPRDWGALIRLLNDDYAALFKPAKPSSGAAYADRLLDRLDTARRSVGATAPFRSMDPGVRSALCAAVANDAAGSDRIYPIDPAAHTVVIEFARGGPADSEMPLEAPHGYAYSLAQLSAPILETAAILYVWVDSAESRRRNRERARPGRDGDASILHHDVPEVVMLQEYGTDDMEWLIAASDQPGTVAVRAHNRTFHVPVVRFDNRVDHTSFLRDDMATWDTEQVARLHEELVDVFDRLTSR